MTVEEVIKLIADECNNRTTCKRCRFTIKDEDEWNGSELCFEGKMLDILQEYINKG